MEKNLTVTAEIQPFVESLFRGVGIDVAVFPTANEDLGCHGDEYTAMIAQWKWEREPVVGTHPIVIYDFYDHAAVTVNLFNTRIGLPYFSIT